MAKVFLDSNYFIDAVHRSPEKKILDGLKDNIVYVSTLSVHIYCYIYKIKTPNRSLFLQIDKFQLIDFNEKICSKALLGPTRDFEDNIQLHSAAEAECDIFLTEDRKLLDMKFFGKLKIDQN